MHFKYFPSSLSYVRAVPTIEFFPESPLNQVPSSFVSKLLEYHTLQNSISTARNSLITWSGAGIFMISFTFYKLSIFHSEVNQLIERFSSNFMKLPEYERLLRGIIKTGNIHELQYFYTQKKTEYLFSLDPLQKVFPYKQNLYASMMYTLKNNTQFMLSFPIHEGSEPITFVSPYTPSPPEHPVLWWANWIYTNTLELSNAYPLAIPVFMLFLLGVLFLCLSLYNKHTSIASLSKYLSKDLPQLPPHSVCHVEDPIQEVLLEPELFNLGYVAISTSSQPVLLDIPTHPKNNPSSMDLRSSTINSHSDSTSIPPSKPKKRSKLAVTKPTPNSASPNLKKPSLDEFLSQWKNNSSEDHRFFMKYDHFAILISLNKALLNKVYPDPTNQNCVFRALNKARLVRQNGQEGFYVHEGFLVLKMTGILGKHRTIMGEFEKKIIKIDNSALSLYEVVLGFNSQGTRALHGK